MPTWGPLLGLGIVMLLTWLLCSLIEDAHSNKKKDSPKVRLLTTRKMRPAKSLRASPAKASSRLIISPKKEIKRAKTPYWREQGWKRKSGSYCGYYRTPYGNYRGEIRHRFSNHYDFYVFSPPRELRKHSHWQCFQHRGRGKYFLHFARQPKDIDSGIMAVERIIREGFEID